VNSRGNLRNAEIWSSLRKMNKRSQQDSRQSA